MFYHRQKNNHTYGFLFVLSLIAAFLLGRKSEEYGYTIISRGCCGYSNPDESDELDLMDDPTPSSDYPQ